jgi:hypothetical protein
MVFEKKLISPQNIKGLAFDFYQKRLFAAKMVENQYSWL